MASSGAAAVSSVKSTTHLRKEEKKKLEDDAFYEEDFDDELLGPPYVPHLQPGQKIELTPREDNAVVFLEVSSCGGTRKRDGSVTGRKVLGRLIFEMRQDMCPVACFNFVALCTGLRGISISDGILYHFKGTKIHRVLKDQYFQAGDLMGTGGDCSRSIYNDGGVFADENFIFCHTGPGCISYCNRGPNTNGSLFQVTFRRNPDMDGRYVVFGCLASDESYETLANINQFGSDTGEPTEILEITDCGIAYQRFKKDK